MKLKYSNTNDERDEQFVSLFTFGIVSALKENLITYEDAWNWFLNIKNT